MGRFRTWLIVWGVVNGMMQELMLAMTDKILTGAEMLRIIKVGLLALRFGLSSHDTDRIEIITYRSQYSTLGFEDGDGLLYVPKDVLDKLKVHLDDL